MGLLLGIGDTLPRTPYDHYYGIEWDVEISNPKCTRIGKMELHASLPVQSLMRRCVLRDDGTVAYYLHPNDSTKMDNGSPAKLDGTDGQVMVELPAFFVKFESEGNKRRCLISPFELPGFIKWEKCYVSAYEATIHRPTNKLSSVVNATPDYRGGNNDASKDGHFSSQLGRPASNFSLTQVREYARNRGSIDWNCYAYEVHKRLFWLFAVEYATFNSQDTYTPLKDRNGYAQGGLGKGFTDITNWPLFGYYPTAPCGVTNALGNKSGFVDYLCQKSDDGSVAAQIMQIPSYRGVENVFGHINKIIDGAKCIIYPYSGVSEFYVCKNKELWSNSGVDGYDKIALLPRSNGYVNQIALGTDGHFVPVMIGASSSTYFCDFFQTNIPNHNPTYIGLLIGGSSVDTSIAGLCCVFTRLSDSGRNSDIGSRLCYLI